jgi:uncharacterized protein YjdB
MKRFLNNFILTCCILCFIIVSSSLWANPIDQKTAKMAAKRFFESKPIFRSESNKEPTIVRTDKKNDVENYFYVIESTDKHGWLILAGNDEVTPIIAYSDEGSFSQSNCKNVNFEYWMDCMKEEINYLLGDHKSNIKPTIQSKAKKEWDRLLKQESVSLRAANESQAADIPRLLGNIIWNQQNNFVNQGEEPTYNKFTPNNLYAGCVAVAIGQIMKAQLGTRSITGTGSYSYTLPDIGTLSANFGNTTYNFADMPDRIWGITLNTWYIPTDEYGNLFPVKSSDFEINAVAQLLYHIGIACNTNYTPSGSSAYTNAPVSALTNYFKYKTPRSILRASVTNSEWINYVQTELQAGRPVYYTGQKSDAGHAFVVDGYRDTDQKYHFNWGWGGVYNGYFALSLDDDEVDQQFAYKNDQQIIIELAPDIGDASVPVTGVSLNQTTATLIVGNTLQLTATVTPTNAAQKTVSWSSSAPDIAGVDATGKVTALAPGTTTITVKTDDGNKTATCNVTVQTDFDGICNPETLIVNVYVSDQNLCIESEAWETIDIYSISGIKVYHTIKISKVISVSSSCLPSGPLIVKGSSGWVKKVVHN